MIVGLLLVVSGIGLVRIGWSGPPRLAWAGWAVALVGMGNSPNSVEPIIQSYSLIIGISCSILNVIGVFLVLRRVNKTNNTELAAPTVSPEN